jgi:hypothetical protein
MLDLEFKIVQILQVLTSMPMEARLLAARRLLPAGYAVVPQQCDPDMQDAFVTTAQRFHDGLKTKLEFIATALPSCWRAMLDRAEHEIDKECCSSHFAANKEGSRGVAPRLGLATDAFDPAEISNSE